MDIKTYRIEWMPKTTNKWIIGKSNYIVIQGLGEMILDNFFSFFFEK